MRNDIRFENIEQMRRRVDIDDVELRDEIRGLAIGDFVKLTPLTGAKSFETLLVRITDIRGSAFRGELAERPAAAGLAKLRVGSPVAFTTAHIHSLPQRRPS